MKGRVLFFLILFPIIASAQGFTLDTIRVSPEDRRNIHQTQQHSQSELPDKAESANNFIFDKTKLRLGANIGLSLSQNYTHLGVGPQVGYQFNKHFMAGSGIKYYHWKRTLSDYNSRSNLLGLNLFGYAYPVSFITMFLQPEINYIWSNIKYNSGEVIKSKGFAPSLVLGAGLRLGYSHITVNYDLVQHTNSPHPGGFFLGVSAFF